MQPQILAEVIPLTQKDCFTLFKRLKSTFDFPLHRHKEYELNLVINAPGGRRIVGDSVEVIGDIDLVFVGHNIQHAWFTHECKTEMITEVTIQFHHDLLPDSLLDRNQLTLIRRMFENSARGIVFPKEFSERIAPKILSLDEKTGFTGVIELLSILNELSTCADTRLLSNLNFSEGPEDTSFQSRRVDRVMDYLMAHFQREISLSEVAAIANMSEVSFCKFFKRRTGLTFVECLLDIRLGHATRLLLNTSQTVSEIAYQCGFNNISNFNRYFKRRKNCTPSMFRESYYQKGVRSIL